MPDSADQLYSPLPQEISAATNPDPEMPPRRSHAGSRLRKPLSGKFRAAAEQRLAHLLVRLRLHPLDPPPPSLSSTASPHEAALRSLGLLDFARLDLLPASTRPDLVARLIAYYDPPQHRSFVHGVRLGVGRTDFVRALSLPPKPTTTSPPPDMDPAVVVSAVLEFMKAYVLPPFQGDDMCILPQEVGAAEQAVKEGSAHKVDWAGLIWGLVEKEILEMPKRDDGVCYYGAYLQRLIWVQKPKVFELLEEEERGEVPLEVSVDADVDEEDGDVDVMSKKSLDELVLGDAVTRSKILEPRDSADMDGDVGSKILEELETEDVDLRSNNLEVLESRDVGTRIKTIDELKLMDMDDSAYASSKRLEILEAANQDANGTTLDESKTTNELTLGLVGMEAVAVRGDMMTLIGEDFTVTQEGDEDTPSVGVADNNACPLVDKILVAREKSLAVLGDEEEQGGEEEDTTELSLGINSDGEEEKDTTGLSLGMSSDGEEEKVATGLSLGISSDGEEEKDTTGLSLGISSANDYDSMDVEENAFVENLDEGDSGNGLANESEDDAFEECRGGVEMNWETGDEKGYDGTTHCFQQCNSSAFAGMEFENLNKGDVGMRDEMSFDDGFPGKISSLNGMESTNLLQAMNSIPATYNSSENAHDLSSGDFLAMGADPHKDGIDLGTRSSFFFGNNGKRHIEDIDGYDDHIQAQGQFLPVNEQKRMRNDSNSNMSPRSATFNAKFSEPIQNLLIKASMFYQQKERELQAVLVDKQNLGNLLQEKETFIQFLNSARCEQESKWQTELRRFEYDLNVMGQLVSGYKKALKRNQAAFDEYRRKFPCDKPRYVDVPSGGGLVLGFKELEMKQLEEEQKKLAVANDIIEKFNHGWFVRFDEWRQKITFMCSRMEGLTREIDLLKQKRKPEISTPAMEE